jgi:hypothetical protein
MEERSDARGGGLVFCSVDFIRMRKRLFLAQSGSAEYADGFGAGFPQ